MVSWQEPEGDFTMKTILLTFAALMLSAQTVDKYFSPELPAELLLTAD
jgi:hypothetical protein